MSVGGDKLKTRLLIAIVAACVLVGYTGVAIAVNSYEWRGTTFEEGSECAELFVDYQTAQPYDIFTKAPAMMKFDNNCNPTP